MPQSVTFKSGPDTITAELRHFPYPDDVGHSAYISFHGRGPRGGYVNGPGYLNRAAMKQLAELIDEAMGWPYRCKGCGREESECSHDPCGDVIAERGEL